MSHQVCMLPYLQGVGGMASFQRKFIQGLIENKVNYSFDPLDKNNDAILVIGGTRQVPKLLTAQRRGVRIVQRLNGMNWLHRVVKTDPKAWLRSETANMLLSYIRRYVCERIAYQSEFSHWWWDKEHGKVNKEFRVIHNGVDLERFTPEGDHTLPVDRYRILLVEGHLSGLYSRGLDMAAQLVASLQDEHHLPVELCIAGDVSETIKKYYIERYTNITMQWLGIIPPEGIPALDRSAHALYSADLNAACPNSVIEATACGLPILAYDTGALKELVGKKAGAIVPYGSNHWQLETPDVKSLAAAALPILKNNRPFRESARKRAEEAFGLDQMTKAYLDVLLG